MPDLPLLERCLGRSGPFGIDMQALIRKRIQVAEPDAVLQMRIPCPLPLSWGRTVQPFSASNPNDDLAAAAGTPLNTYAQASQPPAKQSCQLDLGRIDLNKSFQVYIPDFFMWHLFSSKSSSQRNL